MNDGVDSVEIGNAAAKIVKLPVSKQRLAAEVYCLYVNNRQARAAFYHQLMNSNEKPAQGSELGWVRLKAPRGCYDYVIFVDRKGRLRSYQLTNDPRRCGAYDEDIRIRETLNQLFM